MVLISGCEGISYYSQLAGGQWSLWRQRQPIDGILIDATVAPLQKKQLEKVKDIRQYAIQELALPDNKSYQYYVDLKRSYIAWNVFAAQEFSVEPLQWCFPIAGCVGYRGYFSEQEAQAFAGQLTDKGFETYVGGVSAYSTLGWFADPVLSTFLYRDDAQLAALIFHELAHQKVYLKGDTQFNESFATTVEIAGVGKWMRDHAGTMTVNTGEYLPLDVYFRDREIHQDFVDLVLNTREKLSVLFEQNIPEMSKRIDKKDIYEQLRNVDYPKFKERWGGYSRYDGWFNTNSVDTEQLPKTNINNAKLSTIASYNQWVPSFKAILANCSNDMLCLYDRVKEISMLRKSDRIQELLDLQSGAPGPNK